MQQLDTGVIGENLTSSDHGDKKEKKEAARVHSREHPWLNSTIPFFGTPVWIEEATRTEKSSSSSITTNTTTTTTTTTTTLPKPLCCIDYFMKTAEEVFASALQHRTSQSTESLDDCSPHSFELCHLPEIYSGLYLGNADAAWDTRILKDSGITAILNVTKDQKLAPGVLDR